VNFAMPATEIDNPFFARIYTAMSAHEPESLRLLRRENLTGLTGRVLEVGAGTGTNFAHYPGTVDHVVAVEPERRLAAQATLAAARASVPISVTEQTVESMTATEAEPFDAVVCSLVLCSVGDADGVVQQLYSMTKPGGELRYLEHTASGGFRGRLQRVADATVWPRLLGNCHSHRDTQRAIINAGFEVSTSRRQMTFPAWAPTPVAEFTIGRAVRPR
jgi:SAM-dependent methyltransferase